MFELIDSALQAVRKIASDLRPVVLDYVGLAAAIGRQIMAFQSRSQLACSLTSEVEDLHLCRDRSTAVFRVFQEALSNIARHADATAVDVRLRQEAGELVLNVQDNGKGITEAEASAYESLGLWGMRERVRPLGGSLLVGPMPGGGTLVEVRMPLESSNARAAEIS
jgi:signal transduction histidine kinase